VISSTCRSCGRRFKSCRACRTSHYLILAFPHRALYKPPLLKRQGISAFERKSALRAEV